jgi:DNA-binding winged helix-turn-helix (wHTH) protein
VTPARRAICQPGRRRPAHGRPTAHWTREGAGSFLGRCWDSLGKLLISAGSCGGGVLANPSECAAILPGPAQSAVSGIRADGIGAKLRYSFENYVLDDTRHELRRGDEIVPIEGRVFDLLTYLIRNRERVVSQEDMRLAVWDGRIVSISTISSSMNAVRTAIGDSGDAQRFIRTVPRKGFRFVAHVIEEQAPTKQATSPIASSAESQPIAGRSAPAGQEPASSPAAQMPAVGQPPQPDSSLDPTEKSAPAVTARARTIRAALIFAAGAAAGVLAATLLIHLWPVADASRTAASSRPTKKFDASVVPLVDDDSRLVLTNYPSRPDYKALAIGGGGQLHVADGAKTAENAQEVALQGCFAKFQRPCKVYAIGADIVWPEQAIPLPAPRDLRTEPLGAPLDPDAIPLISAEGRKTIADRSRAKNVSKALALSTGRYFLQQSATSKEAIRVAVERCSFLYERPCLILAVDGFLTVQIPRTRRVTRTFLPSTETEIPEVDRERIARTYQGREWRAIARGHTGRWHAIADAPSEEAATDSALKSCAQTDHGCRLYAIGNFRVVDE